MPITMTNKASSTRRVTICPVSVTGLRTWAGLDDDGSSTQKKPTSVGRPARMCRSTLLWVVGGLFVACRMTMQHKCRGQKADGTACGAECSRHAISVLPYLTRLRPGGREITSDRDDFRGASESRSCVVQSSRRVPWVRQPYAGRPPNKRLLLLWGEISQGSEG